MKYSDTIYTIVPNSCIFFFFFCFITTINFVLLYVHSNYTFVSLFRSTRYEKPIIINRRRRLISTRDDRG